MSDKDNILDGVGKILKMGVGAVANAVEKGVTYVNEVTTEGTEANKRAVELGEDLAKKGEEIIGKTSEFSGQIKEKVKGCMNSSGYDAVMEALDNMTCAELKAIKTKIEALLALKPDESYVSPFTPPEDAKNEADDEQN